MSDILIPGVCVIRVRVRVRVRIRVRVRVRVRVIHRVRVDIKTERKKHGLSTCGVKRESNTTFTSIVIFIIIYLYKYMMLKTILKKNDIDR